MNRDEVLRISRLFNFGGITTNDVTLLLRNYIVVEHNKSIEDADKLISEIIHSQYLFVRCTSYALEYYERKFIICKLYGILPKNSPIMNRQLLQIF